MTLRLVKPTGTEESFELDPIEPRDLPTFRAALREQLGTDTTDPVPMLHSAESVDLLAKALPGARELGLAENPRVSDGRLAVEEGVELDADDFQRARADLTGSLALLNALEADAARGTQPDELSIRHVVRAELRERNRAAADLFRKAGMMPALRIELSGREHAALNAAMKELRDGADIWLGIGATLEDLIGMVVAGEDGAAASIGVFTRGRIRAMARENHRLFGEPTFVDRLVRWSGMPGMPNRSQELLVLVWSREPLASDSDWGLTEATKPPVFTTVVLAPSAAN